MISLINLYGERRIYTMAVEQEVLLRTDSLTMEFYDNIFIFNMLETS